jgi:hypothetical protein
MRRTVLRHAFVFLTVAFLLGLAAGVTSGNNHPHARLWLGSHITGLLVAVMVGVVGLVWNELNLGGRAKKVLFFMTIPMNYYAVVVLGILAPAVGVRQPIATPALPPGPAWMGPIMGVSLTLVTISSLVMAIMVVVGLRGRAAEATG